MRMLITAGPTREYIDPVRFISNASSGKMGYALVRAAQKMGHEVVLVTGPTGRARPGGVKIIEVETGGEMFDAVKKNFPDTDCLIMAAAVCDYRAVKLSVTKIKKASGVESIEVKPTRDILKYFGKNKGDKFVVGFAVEDRDVRARAEKKLKEKNLDMIVANRPEAIGAEKSKVQVLDSGGHWTQMQMASKTVTARNIIKMIEGRCVDKPGGERGG